jgi:hypothetical protein
MIIRAPKVKLILDYKLFFGVEPPDDRISLIKHISKNAILYEISALNYRLKPKNKVQIDYSFETQIKELKYFTHTEELFNKYARIADKYTISKDLYPTIFNRQACLFSIEEIINSEEMHDINDFVMECIEVWEAIVKYFLAVNYEITQIKEEKDDNSSSFESLNPKILPLNELTIETDQIYTLFRGYWLIDYFLKRPDFSFEIKNYFNETYGIEPQHFILHLMRMYMANSSQKPEFNFFYLVQKGDEDLFERLSKRISNNETYKLISIRKSPFIKVGQGKYLISDNTLLIEKAYSQFVNDFWFDWIKLIKNDSGQTKFNIQQYRSEFGYFFEKYLSHILKKCFEKYKYSTLLLFDQLKTYTPKGNIEIADVYFRYGNKILLCQVKSGSIYDTEKYGGNVEQLYKNNRNFFFENFGVNQVIESIYKVNDHIQKLDPKFPKGHRYEIFPCIIVNDKSFQTPLMPYTFNKRFKELISKFEIKEVKVNPLTIIHISDLERLEDYLNKNPKEIWELLKFNHRDKLFAPPFYNTINRKRIGRNYPQRILELFKSLILKYNLE